MKRLYTLLLIMTMLFSLMIPVHAAQITDEPLVEASEEDITRFWELMEEASMMDYLSSENISAPNLTVHHTDTEYYITNTYYPSSIVEFITQKDPELAKKLVMWISYDIRFDDSDWLFSGNADAEMYGQFSQIFTETVTYDSLITEPVTHKIFDLSKYDETLELGPFGDCITVKDGNAYIDFTQHTIEIKQSCIIYCGTYPRATPYSQASALHELTSDTVPTELPAPVINNLMPGKEMQQISFKLQGDAVMSGLTNLGHECYLELRYKIGDNAWTSFKPYYINPATFTVIDEPALKDATPYSMQNEGDAFVIELRYYDKTTELRSEVASFSAHIHKIGNSHSSVNLPGMSDNTLEVETCAICGTCNRPLGVCIRFFIPACVCAGIAIIALVIFLVNVRKDKKSCQSKNSKTPK